MANISAGHTIWNSRSKHQTNSESNNWGIWNLSRKRLRTLYEMWDNYDLTISYYTMRDLSYQSDILNAFEGVMTVLSDAMSTAFWQGIPENILPLALCWQLEGDFQRRVNTPLGEAPSGPTFPSWGWAGWLSRVDLNNHFPVQIYRTDAQWFMVNSKGISTCLSVLPVRAGGRIQRPSPNVMKAFLPNMVPRNEVDATSQE
jgi:hypothetical protein